MVSAIHAGLGRIKMKMKLAMTTNYRPTDKRRDFLKVPDWSYVIPGNTLLFHRNGPLLDFYMHTKGNKNPASPSNMQNKE